MSVEHNCEFEEERSDEEEETEADRAMLDDAPQSENLDHSAAFINDQINDREMEEAEAMGRYYEQQYSGYADEEAPAQKRRRRIDSSSTESSQGSVIEVATGVGPLPDPEPEPESDPVSDQQMLDAAEKQDEETKAENDDYATESDSDDDTGAPDPAPGSFGTTPLELPGYIESQKDTRLVYHPQVAVNPNLVELYGETSRKLFLAFCVDKVLPVDFANISERKFEMFQALYLILCAAGEVETEGGAVDCAYWSVGKHNDQSSFTLLDMVENMKKFYISSKSIFRVFFHTEAAYQTFSDKLLKCSDMLDQRESRIQGPSPMAILKKHINAVPGLKSQRKKTLVDRIFAKPFQFARGVVFLAQSQGTLRPNRDQKWMVKGAVDDILTAAAPMDNGTTGLSTNWNTMFSQERVLRRALREFPDIFEEIKKTFTGQTQTDPVPDPDPDADVGSSEPEVRSDMMLLCDGEDMYRWTLSNTLHIFAYDAFIEKDVLGELCFGQSGSSKEGGFNERVVYQNSACFLHDRITDATAPLLTNYSDLSKFKRAIKIVNSYKATPDGKEKWEHHQSQQLIQWQHSNSFESIPGFHLERGVRPGSAWIREMWLSVENGMLSNSLHQAIAILFAVTYGAIRINELSAPGFNGMGGQSGGKSRSGEHVAACTGKIFVTMTWSSEQGCLRNQGPCIQLYPEGLESVTSTDSKHGQRKKFDKTMHGDCRKATIERMNADGTVTKIEIDNRAVRVCFFNDVPDITHNRNAALFSRTIVYNYDNRKKEKRVTSDISETNKKDLENPPPQQMTIAEGHTCHRGLYNTVIEESNLRTNLFNYYDACRAFLGWSVSVETLGWIFEFLKVVDGPKLITPRITNFVRIFMENYQVHLCVTSLYHGLDVPTLSVFEEIVAAASLDQDEQSIIANAAAKYIDAGVRDMPQCPESTDAPSPRLVVLCELLLSDCVVFCILFADPRTAINAGEMLRCVCTPKKKFMSRVGTVWDVWAKETLMFPGVDSAAASVGLVACPSQDDSQHIRSIKAFLYRHMEDVTGYEEIFNTKDSDGRDKTVRRSRYIRLNMTRPAFCSAFSAYLSVNGDFKEVSWVEALTLKIMNAQPSDPYMRIIPSGRGENGTHDETLLFQKDYLSTVVTTEEEKALSELKNRIIARYQNQSTPSESNVEDYIPADRRFTAIRKNTDGNRRKYSVYEGNCDCLVDESRWVDDLQNLADVKFIELPAETHLNGLNYVNFMTMNSPRIVAPQDAPRLINAKAFHMKARDGESNDGFSRGMAEVMHLMNCTDIDAKGKFRVTVPVLGSEFPIVDPSKYDFKSNAGKKWRRVNPLYIPKDQRKNLSASAKIQLKGSKMHRRKVLKLDTQADNEDILEKQHYDTCRLAMFLASDPDKKNSKALSDTIYRKLLSIRARQKINDASV